ncbi:anhydro-N-acetylmuramic acid kinase [Pontibacter sp. SGAir0037]|uniref:anhydro-N-acetylmuramic acid kinase n=1 Tax=Pontibacter sp. SGAir0037 TaxID=2571030 RepID=UPI0010CD2C43|nr:anhydro-N-acetylmuramic acid kinase [Pontibacter sp. SGAir0037]QCR24090.1 anhydro-N-acetylmuramic acid kinase [Pontibacter sp. SGAir0037]
MNTYHVIGLMSGTSLDGLDIAYCRFTYENENWIYNILNANTLIYEDKWIDSLREAENMGARELIALDHAFGKFIGEQVQLFVQNNQLQPDFIASHGHTVFHQPEQHISLQVGNGAYIAAHAQLPVVCDFRTLDIALGGQGAPLVPVGDALLFSEYDFCVNLGGIANISFPAPEQKRLAYDVCACNMLLNQLASAAGMPYDAGGSLARSGSLLPDLLEQLNAPAFFKAPYPKSLGKEWVLVHSLATLAACKASPADKLHTTCHHIAQQLKSALKPLHKGIHKVLLTGGGAFNTFLAELIQKYLGPDYKVEVPAPEVVSFKEALIFAFLGVLRWRNQANSLSSVTGASTDNVGGAIYWAK